MSDFRMCRRPSHRRIYAISLSLAILVLPLITGSARAQGIDIPAIVDPDMKGPPTLVNLQYGHQFKVDVEDDNMVFHRATAAAA